MAEKKTETALAETISTDDITRSFAKLDTQALNDAISRIADRETKMTDNEKTLIISIITEWEENITKNIQNEHESLMEVINNLKSFSTTYRTLLRNPDHAEVLETIIRAEHLDTEYITLKNLISVTDEAQQEFQDIRYTCVPDDPDMTTIEKLDIECRHRKEIMLKQSAYNKAYRDESRYAFDMQIRLKTDNVRKMISTLAAFDKRLIRTKKRMCLQGKCSASRHCY